MENKPQEQAPSFFVYLLLLGLAFYVLVGRLEGNLFLPLPRLLQFATNTLTDIASVLFERLIHHARRKGVPCRDGFDEERRPEEIAKAKNFRELCHLHGYECEEHFTSTKDGYLLGLHRVLAKKGRPVPKADAEKRVVFLQHGLCMTSEAWVCLTDSEQCLPFRLVESGYDVWLGNNRGNKYSKEAAHLSPTGVDFWEFSIDDFARYDVPKSIQYILDITHVHKLSYIGFSQGSAQAFAALSEGESEAHFLNEKIDLFIALAPVLVPPGVTNRIIWPFKLSPTLAFMFFQRKSFLPSTAVLQSILSPRCFANVMDRSICWIFNWRCHNILSNQKIAAYAHLYSTTSVKCFVHWFQIMRNDEFTVYDGTTRYQTEKIKTSIILVYGTLDNLLDIDTLCSKLPPTVKVIPLEGYEHLDILWGAGVRDDIFPNIITALRGVH